MAVLDDGVDIEHPNLKGRIWRNRDNTDPDSFGRDFFIPDEHPDHFNPRPKRFRFPFDQMAGNDIHGTRVPVWWWRRDAMRGGSPTGA